MAKREVSTIISEWPGHGTALSVAYNETPPDYSGRCVLVCDDAEIAAFPDYEQAARAAMYAINLTIGGYSSAVVRQAAAGLAITHNSADDWIL